MSEGRCAHALSSMMKVILPTFRNHGHDHGTPDEDSGRVPLSHAALPVAKGVPSDLSSFK